MLTFVMPVPWAADEGRSGPGVRASVRVGGRRLFHSPGDRRRAAARAGRTGVGTSRGPRRAT